MCSTICVYAHASILTFCCRSKAIVMELFLWVKGNSVCRLNVILLFPSLCFIPICLKFQKRNYLHAQLYLILLLKLWNTTFFDKTFILAYFTFYFPSFLFLDWGHRQMHVPPSIVICCFPPSVRYGLSGAGYTGNTRWWEEQSTFTESET